MQLVECVPNFSEGRDKNIIDAIAQAIQSIEGTTLLDVDPGADTNRTVMTLVGSPESVLEAAFQGIAKVAQTIDMRHHTGAHARMGACDVCPFVPLIGTTMQDCIELAKKLGKRVAHELNIPVYLYEEAATRPERRNLANIRRGEYEGLKEKLNDPDWTPDFGSAVFNPRSGASVIGAREFLIAFNFNLNTRDAKIANRIAWSIREAGHKGRPGRFRHVKAVGWYMEDFDCAQVTMNLTNYKITPLGEVFDEVCRQAETHGVRCTGSELVGLIPKDCLIQMGRHAIVKTAKNPGVPEPELIRLAIQTLGLNELYPFDPNKKIIEYCVSDPRPLADLSLRAFANETSTSSPAPGGGSISALSGALAAALTCMVGSLTIGKKGYESISDQMKNLCVEAQALKDILVRLIDDDTEAYNRVVAAMRLAKKTDEQQARRKEAIEQATRTATLVPLEVLRNTKRVAQLAREVAENGLKNSASDAGVAGLCARAAAQGAYYNVMINLPGIEDSSWVDQTRNEAQALLEEVKKTTQDIEDIMLPK